jgi:hypothetical protein
MNKGSVAAAAALLLSGCALHPVPEDVTGVDTYHIVRQIRCETREAAAEFVIKELRRLATEGGDQIAQRIVADYDENPETISNFNPAVFRGTNYARVRDLYNVIYTTAIAYNFDLTMTEDNNLGASANFLAPWATSTFTLGLGGNADRQRANERVFTITDTVGTLLMNLSTPIRGERYCDGQLRGANYVYPIAGHIGVDKMVQTFFELVLLADLSAPDKGTPPTMADKLTFTTLVDLTATPKVVFSPVKSGFQTSDASLTGVARRTDVHKVTVGLAVEPKQAAALASLTAYLFSKERNAGGAGVSRSVAITGVAGAPTARLGVIQANTLTATASNQAERLAIIAVDQLKSREIQLVPSP